MIKRWIIDIGRGSHTAKGCVGTKKNSENLSRRHK